MSYGDSVPNHTIVAMLLLVFSIAQPLLAVAAALYFALALFYQRYDLLYVQREAFQSGGLFWPVVCLFVVSHSSLLVSHRLR